MTRGNSTGLLCLKIWAPYHAFLFLLIFWNIWGRRINTFSKKYVNLRLLLCGVFFCVCLDRMHTNIHMYKHTCVHTGTEYSKSNNCFEVNYILGFTFLGYWKEWLPKMKYNICLLEFSYKTSYLETFCVFWGLRMFTNFNNENFSDIEHILYMWMPQISKKKILLNQENM